MGTRVGQRGKHLQRLVDISNKTYFNKGTADIREVPVPIQIMRMDHKSGKIKEARLMAGEFVDYIGIAGNGRTVAFDAKETAIETRFSLDLLKEHQFNLLKSYHEKGAFSFVLLAFTKKPGEIYIMPFPFVEKYWNEAQQGGKKSIPYQDIALNCDRVYSENGVALHYLKPLFEEDLKKRSS